MFLAIIIAGYLLGSIPFGFLLGKIIGGVDIRTHGSGNIGATNVGRVIGWKWFFLVLFLDFLKGFVPTFSAALLVDNSEINADVWYASKEFATIFTGIASIIGHLWPLWLRFKGGKGVATGLGVVTALVTLVGWIPLATALGAFIVIVTLSRYVSFGSICAALAYGIMAAKNLSAPFDPPEVFVTLFCVLMPGLVIWRHRENIVRLVKGTENKVGQRTKKEPDNTETSSQEPAES